MGNSFQSENHSPLLDSIFTTPVLVQDWVLPVFVKSNLQVQVYRSDLLHSWIHGNKAWKLRHLLQSEAHQKAQVWISMGGAFSNHLLALSCLAHSLQKPLSAFVRGHESEWKANPWIRQIRKFGTEIIPLSRSDFQSLHLHPETWKKYGADLQDGIFIPLGGTSPEVLEAMNDWAQQIASQTLADYWCLPVGTGGTCLGLASGLPAATRLLAIEAVRIPGGMESDIRRRIPQHNQEVWDRIEWISGYAGAGFGKFDPVLETFCKDQMAGSGFPLEPVYSGKAFRAVSDLAEKGYFPFGSKLLMIHTGGIFPWNSGHFLPE